MPYVRGVCLLRGGGFNQSFDLNGAQNAIDPALSMSTNKERSDSILMVEVFSAIMTGGEHK